VYSGLARHFDRRQQRLTGSPFSLFRSHVCVLPQQAALRLSVRQSIKQ
jgi:hypothetical protein